MLRMIASRDAEQAKSYYTTGLSREDYYSEGQEIAGYWGGKGAGRLGLSGPVDREAFHALAENRNPVTGERLTPRQDANRRIGYDINFHCPKSVSVLHALTGDRGILDAFRNSVRATMEEMETEMKTRVRRHGKQEDRTTGNMIWGEFVHLTARPVDGRPDPHLHAHVFAMNATYDDVEDRWKAGQFGELKRDAPYYEAAFHSRLAKEVKELGYAVERTDKGWEIAGVPRDLIEKFSQRTALIEKTAEERGLTSDRDLDSLGAATREKKSVGLTAEDLRSEWEGRLSSEERTALDTINRGKGAHSERAMRPEEAMHWALRHVFERASAVPEKRLLEAALERGVGSVTVEDIRRQLDRQDIVRGTLEGVPHCTTREVLAEEKALLDGVRSSRGRHRPFGLREEKLQAMELSPEQKTAARHVLESMDRVVGIRGAAGTGKTTMMKETIGAIRETGKDVFVFAPSAQASRGVLRKEGFHNAETVARLLIDQEVQRIVRNQVIWIDEAGLLGSRSMKKVFDLATRQNARLILSGDSRQHRAVDRGDSLRLLEEKAGLSCARLGTIRRQQGTYRDAIQSISDGKVEEGFLKLEELGAVHQAQEFERDAELADDYLSLVKRGETALVVSPTHAEGRRVTERIREGLEREGVIAPASEQRTVPTWHSLGLTEAERSDPASYREGMVVEFQLNAKGFRKGERWEVIGVSQENQTVEIRCGKTEHHLPLHDAGRFDVFEAQGLGLCPGDLVRVVRNGKSTAGNRLHNGSLHQVKGFAESGEIVLANGWHVAPDFGHLAHGYVLTSHAAQGKTVDHVLISQGSQSWGAANREQFYVSASRGRKSVKVYTDDRDALLDSVLGSSGRASGHDLIAREETKRAVDTTVREERDRILGPLPEPAIEPEAAPEASPMPQAKASATASPAKEQEPVVEPSPTVAQPVMPNLADLSDGQLLKLAEMVAKIQSRENAEREGLNKPEKSDTTPPVKTDPNTPKQKPTVTRKIPSNRVTTAPQQRPWQAPAKSKDASASPPPPKTTQPPARKTAPPKAVPKPQQPTARKPAAPQPQPRPLTKAQKLLAKYQGKKLPSERSQSTQPRKAGKAAALYKKYTGKELRVPDDPARHRDKERGE